MRPRRANGGHAAAAQRVPRISRTVRLPFGFAIRIRRAPSTEVQEAYACAHCGHADGKVDGFWDESTRTIWLDTSVKVRRLRYVLTHEMPHAVADWQHWAFNKGYARP